MSNWKSNGQMDKATPRQSPHGQVISLHLRIDFCTVKMHTVHTV